MEFVDKVKAAPEGQRSATLWGQTLLVMQLPPDDRKIWMPALMNAAEETGLSYGTVLTVMGLAAYAVGGN